MLRVALKRKKTSPPAPEGGGHEAPSDSPEGGGRPCGMGGYDFDKDFSSDVERSDPQKIVLKSEELERIFSLNFS